MEQRQVLEHYGHQCPCHFQELWGWGTRKQRCVCFLQWCSWGVGERQTVRGITSIPLTLALGEEGSGRWTSACSEEGTTFTVCQMSAKAFSFNIWTYKCFMFLGSIRKNSLCFLKCNCRRRLVIGYLDNFLCTFSGACLSFSLQRLKGFQVVLCWSHYLYSLNNILACLVHYAWCRLINILQCMYNVYLPPRGLPNCCCPCWGYQMVLCQWGKQGIHCCSESPKTLPR